MTGESQALSGSGSWAEASQTWTLSPYSNPHCCLLDCLRSAVFCGVWSYVMHKQTGTEDKPTCLLCGCLGGCLNSSWSFVCLVSLLTHFCPSGSQGLSLLLAWFQTMFASAPSPGRPVCWDLLLLQEWGCPCDNLCRLSVVCVYGLLEQNREGE